jgi:hypothetical protein
MQMPDFVEVTIGRKTYYFLEGKYYHKYIIKEDDTLSEICRDYGHTDYMAVYEDPANVDFRRRFPSADDIDYVDSEPFYIPVLAPERRKVNEFVVSIPIRAVSIYFMDSSYSRTMDWDNDILEYSGSVYIQLEVTGKAYELMPEDLDVILQNKYTAGGAVISTATVTLKKERESGDNTIYQHKESTVLYRLGINSSTTNIYEYAAIADAVSLSTSSAQDFCDPLEAAGYVNRGIAFTGGRKTDETPKNTKAVCECAGVDVLKVRYKTKTDIVLLKSQADWFYYSGHGLHSSGQLISNGTMTAAEARANWCDDINMLVLGACSVLDYIGTPLPTYPDKPGVEWAKLLRTKGGTMDYLLGYRYSAPSDSGGGKDIARMFSTWFSSHVGSNPVEPWLNINRLKRAWWACAMDNTNFYYIETTEALGVTISSSIKSVSL